MPTPRTATSLIDSPPPAGSGRSRRPVRRPRAATSSSPWTRLPDAELRLLAGQRRLDARPLGQIDLPDAVAVDVLDVRRAEQRQVHEGVAVERAARVRSRRRRSAPTCTSRRSRGAGRSTRRRRRSTVPSRRGGAARVVGDGEEAGFDRHAWSGLFSHGGYSVPMRTSRMSQKRVWSFSGRVCWP